MLHNALYSQNSLKNFSSKIAWVWLTYIWPFLYYKKTILEWNSGNFWRKFFEGILWIRGIMEHQFRPPRGFVDVFNPFSLKNLESHIVNLDIFSPITSFSHEADENFNDNFSRSHDIMRKKVIGIIVSVGRLKCFWNI